MRPRVRSQRTARSRSPTSTWTASSRSPTCRSPPYDALIATAEDARGDGLEVELGGSGIQQATQGQGGGPSEFIGFIAAAFVLAIAFGSLWGTLLPLITAVLALGCGLSLIGLLAHAIDTGVMDFLFVCDQDDPDTPSPLLSAAMPVDGSLERA